MLRRGHRFLLVLALLTSTGTIFHSTTTAAAESDRASDGRKFLELGKDAFAKGKYDEAAKQFGAAYASDPSLQQALYNQAFAFRKAAMLDDARTAYLKYMAIVPGDNDGLFGLAETERLLRHDDDAARLFAEYLKRESRAEKSKYVDYAKSKLAEIQAQAPTASAASTEGNTASSLAAEAESAYQKGRLDDAARLWKEAFSVAPDRTEYLYRHALALRKGNRLSDAEAAYRQYRTVAPDDLDGLFGLAETMRLSGNVAGARVQYGEYVAKESRESRAKYLSYAKTQLERLDDGAAPLAAKPKTAVDVKKIFDEGMQLYNAKKYDAAAKKFAEVFRHDETRIDALYREALAHRKGGAYLDAKGAYEAYLSRKPDDADGTYGLAETERLRGDVRSARGRFQRYIAIETRASEARYVDYAKAYLKETEGAGQKPPVHEHASGDAGPRHEHGPGFAGRMTVKGLLDHGEAALAAGDVEQTLSHASLALALHAESAPALFLKGRALQAAGDTQEADVAFEKAMAHAGDDDALKDAIKRHRKSPSTTAPARAPGSATVSIERVARANERFRDAKVLVDKRDFDGALLALTEATRENPGHADAFLLAGDIHLQRRQSVNALRSFERALAAAPTRAAPLFGLAAAYEALGETRVARHHYQLYTTSKAADVDDTKRRDAWLKVEGAL